MSDGERVAFRIADVTDGVDDLTASARRIIMTLYHERVVCHGELIEATGLSWRTVRAATKDLGGRGIISARPRLLDARKTDYALIHAGGVSSSDATESVAP